VSYIGRSTKTGKGEARWKACGKEHERVWHRAILYGMDLLPGNKAIVVEGCTDVWRLGPGAVGTFGIDWTEEQRRVLKKLDRVWILFDEESQAQKKAEELAYGLSDFTEVEILDIEQGDPGELPLKEARGLVNDLIGFRI
jgi:hypothetical protein